MKNNDFIVNQGALYSGILEDVKISGNTLQPVFEAFTNSLESIDQRKDKANNGTITVKLYSWTNLGDSLSLQQLVIQDTGIGFNDENFNRFQMYKDNRKGYDNKGSGRLQLIHFFDKAKYESIFKEEGGFKKRTFTISKSKEFLDKNAIIFYQDTVDSDATEPTTTLTLTRVIAEEKFYNELTADSLKDHLVQHYMSYFCSHRDKLPEIIIQQYVSDKFEKEVKITDADIPKIDKEEPIDIYYSKLSEDAKDLVKTPNKETFTIRAFKIPSDKLKKNAIKLTSKGQIVDNIKINLDLLHPDDEIDGEKLLFLVSSEYIEKRDSDVRGNIQIPHKAEYKKSTNLFNTEQIFIEDIRDNVNAKVQGLYEEIKKKKEEHGKELERVTMHLKHRVLSVAI